jgi:hypothetical protein
MANWNFEQGDATPGRNNLFELLDDVETAGLTGNSIIIYNPTTGQWENAEAIGSWAISSTALYLNGATDADSSGMSSSDYPFYAGKKFADRASAPFRVTKAGVLYATGATISGSITATTGNIGGWVVGTDDIKDVAGVVGLSSLVTAGDDIRFWAGHATPGSAPFRLTEAGALVATSATITGDITATSGYFTSVTLGKTGVASGTLTLQLYGTHGDTYIAAGKTDFTVTDPGFILGLDDSDSDKAKLYLGDSTYYMSWDGAMLTYCKGAVVEPTIKLYTSTGVIKTSDTALDGTVNSAGVMIDYQGIYIAGASQDKNTAAIRFLSTGSGYFKGDVTADSGYFNTVTLGKTGVASGTLTLQIYGTHGDTYIAAGKTDFTNTDAGFILGLDDSDSDRAKFYVGDSTQYLYWDGVSLNMPGTGFTSTATAAGTTTLDINSKYIQLFTGSTTQTVTLPVASTLQAGWSVIINNQSTGIVTVKTSGANTIQAMVGVPSSSYNSILILTCINPAGGTGTASWIWEYRASGTFSLTSATGVYLGTPHTYTCTYILYNSNVVLYIPPYVGTSTSTTLILDGLPSIIIPPTSYPYSVVPVYDNSTYQTDPGFMLINPSTGTIQFGKSFTSGTTGGFTATNNKGFSYPVNISYILF